MVKTRQTLLVWERPCSSWTPPVHVPVHAHVLPRRSHHLHLAGVNVKHITFTLPPLWHPVRTVSPPPLMAQVCTFSRFLFSFQKATKRKRTESDNESSTYDAPIQKRPRGWTGTQDNYVFFFFSVSFVSLCKRQGWWLFNHADLSPGEAIRGRRIIKAVRLRNGKDATPGATLVGTSPQTSPEPLRRSTRRTGRSRPWTRVCTPLAFPPHSPKECFFNIRLLGLYLIVFIDNCINTLLTVTNKMLN